MGYRIQISDSRGFIVLDVQPVLIEKIGEVLATFFTSTITDSNYHIKIKALPYPGEQEG